MSTGLIIAIVVVAAIIFALVVMLPRMRAGARHKQAEKELHSRRETVAGEHRSAASERENRAEQAEQEARMAQQTAKRERADANLESERASMHERGMADDELIDDGERDRFADVADTRGSADADGQAAMEQDGTRQEPAATSPDSQQEGRFERKRTTEDVRDSERTRR